MELNSLLWVGWYNDREDEIKDLYKYIKNSIKEGNYGYIAFPSQFGEIDCNDYIRVLWSVLVMEYGNYGTSPRYGWIENANDFLPEFEAFLNEAKTSEE